MGALLLVALSSGMCVLFLVGTGTTQRRPNTVFRLPKAGRELLKKIKNVSITSMSGEAEVPSMLDIVTLGLGAGLSFDASLELYCERYEGKLAAALQSALLAWRLGAISRSEGLRMAAQTAHAPSLVEVAAVVEEALELGLPLAGTLTRQADALRAARRSIVEERIERVPIKMLIPLGTLIVPAMLLAILGPLLGSVVELG